MKNSVLIGFVISSSLFLFGCTKTKNDRAGIEPAMQFKAMADMKKSFEIVRPTADLAVDKAHVVIKKSALGKEFLLSVNLLSQTPTPMFSSLQSRVVSFLLRDEKIYLLDVTKNNVVGSQANIPQTLLIAEFPVLNATDYALEIDFNAGMSRIFVAGDMFGTDDPGFNGADFKLPAVAVRFSYLDEITLENSALFIRQVAQTEVDDSASAVEVRYQLKPYNPDPEFAPVISPGFDKVGYFEANPLLLADGSTRVNAMKWNDKKTIKFAISANTPLKFRKLIRSGLLYWNRILRENAVEVVQLEDTQTTAPHFDVNIIQWSDWDAAGYAFADAHVDPRSGEVTSAQIFLPSAFMQGTVAKRLRLIGSARKMVSLQGFKSARLCNRNVLKDISAREESEEATPAAMEKAVNDYVYEVVAHELGHVLGLRHNFAGNLAANYDFKDRKNLILSYYKNQRAPEGIVTSNSVMEYSRFEESSWNGDIFQNSTTALAYDEMAVKFLYLKTALPQTGRPIFCTDSDISTYADCNMSDAGRSIVSAAAGAHQFNIASLAARLVNVYITKSKVPEEKATVLVPASEVNLNVAAMAETLMNDFAKLVSLMKAQTKFIAVRAGFQPVLNTMLPQIENLEKTYLADEYARLGGLESLLQGLPVEFENELNVKFAALMNDSKYNSGFLPDGTRYSFSATEKETMKKQVALFAAQVKEEFILNELKILNGENISFEETYGQVAGEEARPWADSETALEFARVLLKKFSQYVLTQSTDKLQAEIVLKDGSRNKVELPVYLYPQKIRLASTGLFTAGHKAIEWGFLEKQTAVNLVENEMSLLGEPDKLDLFALDRNVLKWYLNNKKVYSTLTE